MIHPQFVFLADISYLSIFGKISLITHMFVHLNISHLLSNVVFFLLFGAIVERRLGYKRFMIFLLVSCTLTGILWAGINIEPVFNQHNNTEEYFRVAGLSGVLFSCIAVSGWALSSQYLTYYGITLFCIELAQAVNSYFAQDVDLIKKIRDTTLYAAHDAHVAGYIAGIVVFSVLMLIERRNRDVKSN